MNGLLVWFFGHLFNEITDFQGHLNSYLFSASFKKPTKSVPYLFCGCPVIWFFKVTLFILWVSWRQTMISSKEIWDFVSGNLSLNPLFSFTFFGRFWTPTLKRHSSPTNLSRAYSQDQFEKKSNVYTGEFSQLVSINAYLSIFCGDRRRNKIDICLEL